MQAIAAPCGALVLKLLPARQLEAVVSVLMVIMISLINKRQIKQAAAAAQSWLTTSAQFSRLKSSGSVEILDRDLS